MLRLALFFLALGSSTSVFATGDVDIFASPACVRILSTGGFGDPLSAAEAALFDTPDARAGRRRNQLAFGLLQEKFEQAPPPNPEEWFRRLPRLFGKDAPSGSDARAMLRRAWALGFCIQLRTGEGSTKTAAHANVDLKERIIWLNLEAAHGRLSGGWFDYSFDAETVLLMELADVNFILNTHLAFAVVPPVKLHHRNSLSDAFREYAKRMKEKYPAAMEPFRAVLRAEMTDAMIEGRKPLPWDGDWDEQLWTYERERHALSVGFQYYKAMLARDETIFHAYMAQLDFVFSRHPLLLGQAMDTHVMTFYDLGLPLVMAMADEEAPEEFFRIP